MLARFHRRVQFDLDEVLDRYYGISERLGDDFLAEFQIGVKNVCLSPKLFHFDSSGLRRYTLERFPYHFLYDIRSEYIRIWVVRHDRRNPAFGLRRFQG